MIEVNFTLPEDDIHVLTAWMREAPKVGDLIWPNNGWQLHSRFGSSAFRVLNVAHWVNSEWSPATHVGEPVHTVCAYVEPILRDFEDRKP